MSRVARCRAKHWPMLLGVVGLLLLAGPLAQGQFHRQDRMPGSGQIGIFDGEGDVGTVLHKGSAHFDGKTGSYTVSGSGENMWFGIDDFHYVYTKASGDVALMADINFVGKTGNAHRKAALMLRQTMDTGAVYADAARHGDGLTSLQYRDAPGADTHEVEISAVAPERVRIEKRGNYAYFFLADAQGRMVPAGAAMRVDFAGDFFVGLAVCAHDKDRVETAIFSNVKLERLPPVASAPVLYSTIETVIVASSDRRIRYAAPAHMEAPNWTRDGAALLYNQDGKLYRWRLDDGIHPNDRTIPLATAPEPVSTGILTRCNDDHGLSPDGTQMAVSCEAADGTAHLYTLPSAGGTPREVTPAGPSFWHGWSPDGATLAFSGQRGGTPGLFTVPVAGGAETRVATAPGALDGPEFSPDGRWIYFNSARTGHMQIWRMHPDGSAAEQVLTEDTSDWYPHLSPDGKAMVYLAYAPGVEGHPANQDVEIRLVPLTGTGAGPAAGKSKMLAKLLGGQGTLDVPSWAPDGSKIAFVSYALIPQQDISAR